MGAYLHSFRRWMEVRGQFHSPAALRPREINVPLYSYRAMRYNSFYKIVNLHILIHILYVHDVCLYLYVSRMCICMCKLLLLCREKCSHVKGLGGPRTWCGRSGVKKNFFPLSRFVPRTLQPVAWSVYRLLISTSIFCFHPVLLSTAQVAVQ